MSRNFSNRRLYVGEISRTTKVQDLKECFRKFGLINEITIKDNQYGTTNFAFIEFDEARDAREAMRRRNGYILDGEKLRVEFTRTRISKSSRPVKREWRNRHNRDLPHSKYRVHVSGLPPTGSWQDLKDYMRQAGDVCFANVYKDGTGVVEFTRYQDMKYAARELDNTKFKSHEGETAYIRVRNEYRKSQRSSSRSSSPSESKSQSPKKNSTRSRSSSQSSRRDKKSASRSKSRSPSRSRSTERRRHDKYKTERKRSKYDY